MLLQGWAKEVRFGKKVGFIHLTDGIKPAIQIVISGPLLESLRGKVVMGTSLKISGRLVESIGPEQEQEVQADEVEVIGLCDSTEYPIQKKDTSLEFLRTISHLRMRTDTFQAVFRIRSFISQEIHRYLASKDFMWVHTPIITGSDCEGAGEMFQVKAGEDHFFGQEAGLTVSGQLEVETFAQAFSKVYSFGPTFRAEDSNTARHASEFWMLEPEVAFADLDVIMSVAEDLIKHLISSVMLSCQKDLDYLRTKHELDPKELEKILTSKFQRISHQDAQDILVASGETFQYPIGRGESLQAEHEKYLCKHFDGPVFVTDYPRMQKAFYMKASGDRSTVRCTDLLFPRIGEIIGGSQREDDYAKLEAAMLERGIDPKSLQWYLDLRKFGSTPHSGFGLGLERFLMWITGIANIRDAIPYPRVPGKIF